MQLYILRTASRYKPSSKVAKKADFQIVGFLCPTLPCRVINSFYLESLKIIVWTSKNLCPKISYQLSNVLNTKKRVRVHILVNNTFLCNISDRTSYFVLSTKIHITRILYIFWTHKHQRTCVSTTNMLVQHPNLHNIDHQLFFKQFVSVCSKYQHISIGFAIVNSQFENIKYYLMCWFSYVNTNILRSSRRELTLLATVWYEATTGWYDPWNKSPKLRLQSTFILSFSNSNSWITNPAMTIFY